MQRGKGEAGLDPAVGSGTPFHPEDVAGLDAALVLKRTGVPLGTWGRDSVDLDVVSVMTATLLGSVETIAQAMHGEIPPTLAIESGGWRMLATRLESQAILVLIAPGDMREGELRRRARVIADRLGNGGHAPRVSVAERMTAPPRAAIATRSR